MPLRPEVIKVDHGTELHKQLVTAVKQRLKLSRDKYSDVRSRYALDEEAYRAYIKPTTKDSLREELKRQGKPQFTTIYVPYTLAVLWAAHTYWSSVFLGRTPIWQFTARHAEPHKQVLAVEAVLDYQVYVGRHLVPYYLWLMDAGKYGRGILGTYWADESVITTKIEEQERTFLGVPMGSTKKVKTTFRVPGYSGNKVYNVRPQDWFPDPRVPPHRFQDGEFCGRIVEVGWNTILRRESEGWYYNVDALRKHLRGARSFDRDPGSSQLTLPEPMDIFTFEGQAPEGKQTKSFVELLEMTIELVPKDWQLGASTAPEKYVFSVGNENVILGIRPLGEIHDQYPFALLEFEMEGYSINKRSMFEIGQPLNDTLTWLFNAHMFNVRKALHDMLFVDPSRFVMKDLTDPNAGKLVRLKPEYYGSDVKLGVHQLQIVDVTRSHMQDAAVVVDMLMRLLGVNDSIMGMLHPGGRKTATEVRTSSSFGINRQKTTCEWYSALGFQPLADMMVKSTQQHFEGERQVRAAGDLLGRMGPMNVTPDLIAGFYDFVPVDGTMPVDRFALANLWKELLLAAQQMPQVAGQYDIAGMFGWIAQMSGIKNLEQFRVQVMAPEAIQNAVRAGNIVPIAGGEGGNRGPTGGGGEAERDFTQVPNAAVGGGVGRTG